MQRSVAARGLLAVCGLALALASAGATRAAESQPDIGGVVNLNTASSSFFLYIQIQKSIKHPVELNCEVRSFVNS